MPKNRLESFSDGVIAIVLTIMVLELKVPKEPTLGALGQLWPVYFAYLLSFFNIFMMWLSHHEIVDATATVNLNVLLANGVLLFTMSLVPFALDFAAETHWTATVPVAFYGFVMFLASLAFGWFRLAVGAHSRKAEMIARQRSEALLTVTLGIAFLGGMAVALVLPRLSLFLYAAVPLTRVVYRLVQPLPARA